MFHLLIVYLVVILGLWAVGSLLVVLIATESHERSHWVIARYWTSDLSIVRFKGLIAKSIIFHDPYALPTWGMRLCGVSPALFGLSVGVVLYTQLPTTWEVRLLVSVPFIIAGLFLSPSDYLAIFFPRRFQKEASETDSISHREAFWMLIEETSMR